MMNITKIGKRIDAVEKQITSRMVAPVLILRAKDYEGGTIPPDVTKKAQHVILIKTRQTRVGESDEYSIDQQTH